jgi:predicted NUDIX family NTP pyrophosphohydrolase
VTTSAGLLMARRRGGRLEVLLAHPGGPFFTKKDAGAWTIPKGLVEAGDDDLLAAARREFEEETGLAPAAEAYLPLGSVRQKGGKQVHAWAFLGDADADALASNTFSMEWPPRSGRAATFPELDRFAWFDLEEAGRRILAAQRPFLERGAAALGEA